MKKTQLVVIGAGPGGYAAAFLASDLGLQVILVDPEVNPGGVCLYKGCIPSKALLHIAKVLNEAKDAKNFGVDFASPKIDIDKMRSWKNGVVSKMTGGLGILSKQRKINYIQGSASFLNQNTLKVKTYTGATEEITFDHAIIATGSYPIALPHNFSNLWNSTTALELSSIPKSLLVVGGGYIGLELGTVYAALGSKVSVVEMTSGLLAGVDRDLTPPLFKRLEETFEQILLNTKVSKIKESKAGLTVEFEGSDIKKSEQTFEKILAAVGRKPNTQGLGLENTKIKINEHGFINVNLQRQTTQPNIYAIGDVAGGPMLAHKASHEGRVAVEAIAGHKVAFEPKAIPAVVFTDPEIAWCGLTETEAQKENRNIQVVKFPWGASGRAATLDRNDGLTKLIIDPQTQRVLGVGIVGSGAEE